MTAEEFNAVLRTVMAKFLDDWESCQHWPNEMEWGDWWDQYHAYCDSYNPLAQDKQ